MDSAIACFEESRRLKKSALAIRPNDDWQFEDIVTESMIAGIDASAGRLRKADTAYGTLIGRLDRLLKNDSGAFDREKELTNLLQHYAMLALELGEIEQAQHRVDQALARLPRLTSNEPGNAIWRAHHANALLIAAEVARHRGNQAEARSKLAEASALLQSDGRENPYSNALKSFVMFKMGILQGDVDGGRAASDALSALKILASDGGYNTIILAADALLLQAAAMAERGDTAAAHAHARDASSLLARLKPGRSDIKVMGLLARVALLGETPPVSSAQAFQRIDKASYRHPDYLEALSLFCRASAGSGREPPSRCRTPESAKVETDPGTGRQ
jgi:tetratricopeptide (TPR) repeat protein